MTTLRYQQNVVNIVLMNESRVVSLDDVSAGPMGAKAANLGRMLRAGFPVPEGFVVPAGGAAGEWAGAGWRSAKGPEVQAALDRMGFPPVAVRSSGINEDSTASSAAGQYESFLAVEGLESVMRAIEDCRRSALAPRVAHYRARIADEGAPDRRSSDQEWLAVVVQRHIDADVSGVVFTPSDGRGTMRIESTWGLGTLLVDGSVSPDAVEVGDDGGFTYAVGSKARRADRRRDGNGLVVSGVPGHQRAERTLDGELIADIVALAKLASELFGAPQDIEWAISGRKVWMLQSRPITAALPEVGEPTAGEEENLLVGTPAAHGVIAGPARVVRAPDEFGNVRSGNLVVCPYTDPAWTPLLAIAGGVVTEVGGALSHAAIVAREYGIPAVAGVEDATRLIADGAWITVDGSAGTVTLH